MTYSLKVRAPTRAECKLRVTSVLQTQTTGQPNHRWDRPHVERMLHALIDMHHESPANDIVADAYGYVTVASNGAVTTVALNVKVYSSPHQPDDTRKDEPT